MNLAMKTLQLGILICSAILAQSVAFADSSDSDQPIQIYSDQFEGDDVNQTAVYEGNVSVHQGTMEIHGNRLTLSIDPQGYRHAVMTPLKGKLVNFKQRRDPTKPGVEEWMHGKGDKLTYDEKNNNLILTNNAVVSRSENGVLKDQSTGQEIVYNLTSSTATIQGNKQKGSSGRVNTVIAPRNSAEPKSQPLKLKPNRGPVQ